MRYNIRKIRMGFGAFCLILSCSCDIAPSEVVLDGKEEEPTNSDGAHHRPSARQGSQTAILEAAEAPNKRPNIVLIVADDLGYFDIGAFGGEIRTPNLDALAQKGVRFRQLRAAPVCAPSRAMLMTGADNHIVGIGSQFPTGAQIGAPGYEGFLSSDAVTVPEVLRDAGYNTFMVGKWHLGLKEEHSPAARGFQSSFALLLGAGGHFDMTGPGPPEAVKAIYREDGKLVDELPSDFYSTDFYTDRIINDIEENRPDGKPFFAYVAYTSPHWPLQAPEEYLNKYKGAYNSGYEEKCLSRFENAKSMNVIPSNTEFNGCRSVARPWASLSEEERRREARLMEIYAAMVDNLDFNIGRIIDHLESIGELENTFIFFMSDNGADEGRHSQMPQVSKWIETNFDNSLENLGHTGSYAAYGQGWATVGMSPLKDFKGKVSDGGIRVPAIVYYPPFVKTGAWFESAITNRDIAPTLFELAGAKYPTDSKIHLEGKSFIGELRDPSQRTHSGQEVFSWEQEGSKAVIQGEWKLVRNVRPIDNGWRLFNLREDLFEENDLSAQVPEKVQEMIVLYEQYAQKVGVVDGMSATE
ncbi:MAG: arylsulfatase [SAR92 clade bacterium]|nr:arylsulfatase [SAR92 clade bacterium]